jgi:hypothetical protein
MTANRRRDRERPLKRRVAVRQPRKTILIFCEGERTEPEYLDALKRQPWVRDIAAVDLRVKTGHGGGSVPTTLVSLAADARRKALDEEGEIDEFWCVFDVEWPRNHPHLRGAIEQARQGGIELAISNPCFELWLVLHFQDHSSWLDNDHARRLRQNLDGSDNKGIDAATYMPLVRDAVTRAKELDERHRQNGTTFPHDNPSSGMHRLLATIEHRRAT